MIRDILTVMWKERKGLFRQGGSRSRALLTLLVPVIMLAIFLPWQIGADWVETYWSILASVLIPLLLVGTVIPESFAGERERYTLSTLLASRLPDRAILFGKIAMAVGYGWGITLIVLIISLVTVNIAHWDGQLMLFTPTIALVNIVFSLILASIMACLGVLISLRASTVQGATQFLMAATLFPLILLQVAGVLVLQVWREWFDNFMNTLATVNWTQVILIIGAVLVLVCAGLIWAVMARFKRARLILS